MIISLREYTCKLLGHKWFDIKTGLKKCSRCNITSRLMYRPYHKICEWSVK